MLRLLYIYCAYEKYIKGILYASKEIAIFFIEERKQQLKYITVLTYA